MWASEEFRRLAREDTWLSREVIPLLKTKSIGWITPPDNSRFYFSAWLINCVMRREYDNKIIQDLYVLHEALHAATLDSYFSAASNPFLALRVNEIEVSLETEAWVYIRQPELIGKTFTPLWVTQPELFSQTKEDRASARANGQWEDDYRALAQGVGWVLARPNTEFLGAATSEPAMWWARRHSTFHPQTQSDLLVKRYDDLSLRWINKVLPRVNDVNYGRALLLSDRDAFMKYLERNIVNDLPFGDLNPAFKPGTEKNLRVVSA